MKNISFVINGILTVAVAVLFYLHFSSPVGNSETKNNSESREEETIETPVTEEEEVMVPLSGKIGYLNIDSLHKNYTYYSVLIKKLENKQKKYEREMQAESSVFQQKFQAFQQQAPTMTQFEGQLKQKELAKEEQDLYKLREEFAIKFQEEQLKLNRILEKKVNSYIKKLNETANYDIIIGSSQVGNIVLDYNKGIDITSSVSEGLNKEYEEEKKIK